MTTRHLLSIAATSAVIAAFGCAGGEFDVMGAAEPYATADAGADGDNDIDMDGDIDALPDYEGPPRERFQSEGVDAFDGGVEDWNVCENGEDEDEDGLVDCSDFGCLEDPICCSEAERPWIDDLDACGPDLAGCGWTAIPSQGGVVNVTDGAVHLGGDGEGLVGISTAPVTGIGGGPVLTFVGAFAGPSCGEASCPQVFGVALTAQPSIGTATGVEPVAGVVLDGESRTIQFLVGGRVAGSDPFDAGAGPASVRTPLVYGLQLYPDGAVGFWSRLTPAELDATGAPATPPDFESPAMLVGLDTSRLRVVVFGRLSGLDVAQVSGVRLESLVCDLPGTWSRPSATPALMPAAPDGHVRNPAVFAAGSALGMIFEDGHGLVEAISDDGGESWGDEQRILAQGSSTRYGVVAVGAPTVLAWAPDGEPTLFHLWYEAEAEAGADTPAGVTPTAILHAVSEDGVLWVEAEEPIAVEALPVPWRARVGAPTVTASPDGNGLRMWFLGQSAYGVESGIVMARSDDAKTWTVDEAPIQLGDPADRPLPFERDGRDAPEVAVRGGVLHLWYVGYDGARSTIGYAVSSDGVAWARFGQVLEADMPWEFGRLAGPSVVVLQDPDDGSETLQLWYHGGVNGRERIGVVSRELPNLDGDAR